MWPFFQCLCLGLDFKVSIDTVLGFQDVGPALPSQCQVFNGRDALLSAVYPFPIVLSSLRCLYAYRAGIKGKGS